MHMTLNIKSTKKKFDRRKLSQRLRSTTKKNNDDLLKRILNKNTNEQTNITMKMKND